MSLEASGFAKKSGRDIQLSSSCTLGKAKTGHHWKPLVNSGFGEEVGEQTEICGTLPDYR
jgi:hypothetical protein